ncbi:hypothetical protein CO051_00355 [Candidatus Roizmanbacteria bacterium CG_4_9_14_0_2_um_filter_39_13]|uniref:N-acetyltransferase domain-containing protein n=1 Tax=Candidatus Roizmanbacteria bacterium CG_4_9_14_0_2_um_filter_39_13 TaxID=1974839 RepID=A0A2M8F4G1_9BACT|nr:MAG: hypothetical protein COY15_00500 [Candidatus Roizmanbacteria bacterium CG_4_10_14_0_2_um_filter_39_12]PJC34167.1 MAG: hypothetical protein CO051_00355 [Candidatus Roizmanbacteria bacterium CG_4_9_14_0_2_um_filter_39_13]
MPTSGTKIEDFISKSGKNIILRYIHENDAEELFRYVNELSKEDTFIRFSGETVPLIEEKEYLQAQIEKLEKGDVTPIVATHHDKIIGNSSIERNLVDKRRGLHTGNFGMAVSAEYRGDWIGEKLMRTVIDQAKKHMQGLRIIRLTVYGSNNTAQNLYKKMGFLECGRLPKGVLYRGTYLDMIEMYLEI